MPKPGQYQCGFCDQGTKPPCDECALAILLEKYPELIKTLKQHSISLERFIQYAPKARY